MPDRNIDAFFAHQRAEEEAMARAMCECNGGEPCDCPDCDHEDCSYQQDVDEVGRVVPL